MKIGVRPISGGALMGVEAHFSGKKDGKGNEKTTFFGSKNKKSVVN